MGSFLILIGGGFLMAVVAVPIAVYLNQRHRENGRARSFALFAIGTLVAGALTGSVFVFAISPVLCAILAGESCAWATAIVGAPAFFAFGVVGFLYVWVRRGKAP